MSNLSNINITVIYMKHNNLEVSHDKLVVTTYVENQRIVFKESYKKDKTILAVIKGHVTLLNAFGERAENIYNQSTTTQTTLFH